MALYDSYTKLMLHMNDSGFSDKIEHSVANINTTIETTTKKFGNGSAYFNGNSKLTIANAAEFNASSFTVEAWVYIPTQTSGSDRYIYKRYDSNGFIFYIDGNGYLRLYSFNGSKSIAPGSSIKINANTWTHVACSYAGSTCILFINGIIVCQFNIPLPSIGSGKPITIGEGFVGYIDEVRLSVGIARWTSNFTPATSQYGTVYLLKSANAYYSIDQSCYDISNKAYIPLSLSGGVNPNLDDIDNYGFTNTEDLIKSNTINNETFKPIDKMYSNFEIKEYKLKEEMI